MQTYRKVILAAVSMASIFIGFGGIASAAVSDAAPNQEQCDSGSVTYTWDDEGLDRPVIASMTVDGETIADPTSPDDGSIGVAICANVENARKTGLTVIYRDGMNYHQDLTDAETPAGNPITADSEITITLTDMGELAEFYTFSLVHGHVSNWETENLGQSNASLSFTISPVRTTLVDFEADGAQFCSATPPVCDVEQSGMDILNASLDMDFDQTGHFAEMTGAYFGLVSAVSGYVVNENGSLSATLGAPHFLEDGSTVNVGSLRAFLPTNVVENILGLEAGEVTAEMLSVTRSEDGEVVHDDPPFAVEEVTGGIVIALNNITFSSPTYTIQAAAASGEGGGSGAASEDEALADTGSSQNVVIALAALMVIGGVFSSSIIKNTTFNKHQ